MFEDLLVTLAHDNFTVQRKNIRDNKGNANFNQNFYVTFTVAY